MAPGTLVHVGKKRLGTVQISCIDYSEGWIGERAAISAEDPLSVKRKPKAPAERSQRPHAGSAGCS